MLAPAVTSPPATDATKRLAWIDLLRGAAVCFVMLNHVIGMTEGAGWAIPGWLTHVTRVLEPYRLPMLLVVSGMFLPRALSKPTGTYLSGKAKHLVWPLLLWTPVTIYTHTPDKAGQLATWLGPSHLWYLKTLVICYALALLSRWIPLWIFPTLFLGVWFSGLWNDAGLLWYGSFFFLGALLEPWATRVQRAPRWLAAALFAIAGLGAWLHVTGLDPMFTLPKLGFGLVGVLALLWLAPRIPRVQVVRWFEGMGRHSIVYYVVHLPVIAVALRILHLTDVGAAATMLIAALACFLTPFLMRRIPGHEWLFSFPGLAARPATPSAPSRPGSLRPESRDGHQMVAPTS